MTTEVATLLAQIIPVLGLGVGLEIRQLGPQLIAQTTVGEVGMIVRVLRFVLGISSVIPISLGAVEIKTIFIVMGGFGDWFSMWGIPLFTGVFIIFAIPSFQGLMYYFQAFENTEMSGRVKQFHFTVMSIFAVGFFVFLLIGI